LAAQASPRGSAPVAYPAAPLQCLEAAQGLGQRDAAAPVQQVQVDLLQPQGAQAALAGGQHPVGVGVLRQHLADDETLLARHAGAQRTVQRLAEHGFRAALAIHLGGVEDAVADLQRQPQGAHLGRAPSGLFAEAAGAQAQRGTALAAGEGHCRLIAGGRRVHRTDSVAKPAAATNLLNAALSSDPMQGAAPDLAQVRLDNALALFEEFVRATARHADAATLRGLERRFAERVQIQPSYWSQIKGRSRQIGERLARQFEHLCHKPRGWMDAPHGPGTASAPSAAMASPAAADEPDTLAPRDDDERFIVGLVLTYYRRHPQRARVRLLDLLGEVLTPGAPVPLGAAAAPVVARRPATPPAPETDDELALWQRTQSGVAPLKRKP
jgi:hypothetical protein